MSFPSRDRSQPGKPPTAAIAIIEHSGGEYMEALELDGEGDFIPPYDWGCDSLTQWTEDEAYAGVTWIDPRTIQS